jgi:FkbM family methyltransferase
MKIFENIIKSGDLVFDVGANIGAKSQLFRDLGANVIAFEPQLWCAERIRLEGGIRVEPLALGATAGAELFYQANADTISSMSPGFIDAVKRERFADFFWNPGTLVAVETLDNMIDKYGIPRFIKIDVEGYEFNVLLGLTVPIACISIEFVPELLQSTIACINYLESLSPAVYNYGRRDAGDFYFPGWIDKAQILTYLNSIRDYRIDYGDVYIKSLPVTT